METFTEVDFAVRDDYQDLGIGRDLISHLIMAAKKEGPERIHCPCGGGQLAHDPPFPVIQE